MIGTKIMAAAMLLIFGLSVHAEAADYNIEQINANMPDIVVYYTVPGGTDDSLISASLGSDALKIEEQTPFSASGEPVEYNILLDISKSVEEANFRQALEELVSFKKMLRSGDRMLLDTFGDDVQRPVLTGGESAEEAEQIIREIKRESMNTYLIQAVLNKVDQIGGKEEILNDHNAEDRMKRVVIVISDGFDDADSSVGRYSAIATLQSAGVPVYTIALNASLQRSDEEKKSRRAELNDIANSTGGIPWSVDMADSISMADAFQNIRKAIEGENRAVLKAPTNKANGDSEQLTLGFASGKTIQRAISVNRHTSDETHPEASAYESAGRIRISYSEKVVGGTERNNYLVQNEGKNLVIVKISDISVSPLKTDVELIFEDDPLQNGNYNVTITGVTDNSAEMNPLEKNVFPVEIREGTLIEKTEETTKQTTEATTRETTEKTTKEMAEKVTEEIEEEKTISEKAIDFLKKWWPLVLAAVILLVALLMMLFFRRGKRNRDGEIKDQPPIVTGGAPVVIPPNAGKTHVGFETPVPEQKLTIWLDNGNGESKRLDRTVYGSMIVGRSSKECDIYCDDPNMSKQHFMICIEDNGLFVTDLNSTNGTSLNGVLLGKDPMKLTPGDSINAGNIHFVVEWDQSGRFII